MNKKVEKTRRKLREALLALIDNKDLDQITVSELCAKARINRTTFYKYYALPVDVLREYFQEINDLILGQIQDTTTASASLDIQAKMLHVCQVYYDHQQHMRILVKNIPDIMPQFSQVILQTRVGEIRELSLIYFIAGGVTAMILQWVMSSFALSPLEISQILTRYIVRLLSAETKDISGTQN
ncbi:MAG TPA: hypothetical protein DCM45_07435 [Clostridiales bacterium]|nr:hypothetical protein [Clostridiales bacterium]